MTTPTGGSHGQLRHDALFYSSGDQFTAGLVPFLREGLGNGDALVAAVTRANIGLLRDALGSDARHVNFIDRDQWYRRPAVTIAGWQRLLGQATDAGHGFVRIVGEVAFGDAGRHQTWTRYESALNPLFAQAPAWIVCLYDSRVLPPRVLDDARRTHPAVFDPTRGPSGRFVPADRLLRQLPEPMPAATGTLVVDMPLQDPASIAEARAAVGRVIAANGWRERLGEVQLVVAELAANSLRHGAGRCEFRLWVAADALTGEVTDQGGGSTTD